jgi:hypothetical protein
MNDGQSSDSVEHTWARIMCRFHARDLHLVVGPSRLGATFDSVVSIDGPPPGSAHGGDVDEGGNRIVVEQRCSADPTAEADRRSEVRIGFIDAGLEAFAFTFGGCRTGVGHHASTTSVHGRRPDRLRAIERDYEV